MSISKQRLAKLSAQHWLVMRDAIGGCDFTWNPVPEVAALADERRHELIGYADHELIEWAGELAPELIVTCPPMGKNPHAKIGAMVTEEGERAIEVYFASRVWRVSPRTSNAEALLENYNLYLQTETEWDTITMSQLLAYAQDSLFKYRWAPFLRTI